jgi:hypothetical protein
LGLKDTFSPQLEQKRAATPYTYTRERERESEYLCVFNEKDEINQMGLRIKEVLSVSKMRKAFKAGVSEEAKE